MFSGDIVIFINDDGETMSFVRGQDNWTSKGLNGYPTDEDIHQIKQQKNRKWIHIRGEYVVALSLANG